MNRDNLLYLLVGLLVGFVSSYLLFEAMVERQPTRLVHGVGEVAAAQPGGGAGAPPAQMAPPPAAVPGGGGGGPAVARVRELRERVDANPEDADAVLELANMNFSIQDWIRARDLFEQYLRLRPESPDVASDLGICLRALGEFDEALASFDRAISMAPDHWLARYNKVIVLALDLKDFEGAREVLAQMEALQPGNADLQRLKTEVERLEQAA